MSLKKMLAVTGLVAAAAVAAPSYVEAQPLVYQAPVYTPQYYQGHVVFFDANGNPFVYVNGTATYVPQCLSYYGHLKAHYRLNWRRYRSWSYRVGHRYRRYRRAYVAPEYTPLCYGSYVVYYDDWGYPFYYAGSTLYYIPSTYVGYSRYVRYYRRHRSRYLRWWNRPARRHVRRAFRHRRRTLRRTAPYRSPRVRIHRRTPRHRVVNPTPRHRRRVFSPTPRHRRRVFTPTPRHRRRVFSPTPRHRRRVFSPTPRNRRRVFSPTPRHRRRVFTPAPRYRRPVRVPRIRTPRVNRRTRRRPATHRRAIPARRRSRHRR